MRLHLRRNRRQRGASPRLFTLEDLRLTMDCAFQAGRQLGFRASQQLAVACRQYRTYLILFELQRLEQALVLANRLDEAAGVRHAVCAIREQFSVPTQEEAAAFEAGRRAFLGGARGANE